MIIIIYTCNASSKSRSSLSLMLVSVFSFFLASRARCHPKCAFFASNGKHFLVFLIQGLSRVDSASREKQENIYAYGNIESS